MLFVDVTYETSELVKIHLGLVYTSASQPWRRLRLCTPPPPNPTALHNMHLKEILATHRIGVARKGCDWLAVPPWRSSHESTYAQRIISPFHVNMCRRSDCCSASITSSSDKTLSLSSVAIVHYNRSEQRREVKSSIVNECCGCSMSWLSTNTAPIVWAENCTDIGRDGVVATRCINQALHPFQVFHR